MKTLHPGQAALTRHDGQVCVVLCDWKENLPIGAAELDGAGDVHQVDFGGLVIAAVELVLRLRDALGAERYYRAWVNELEEHILEDLATLPELNAILATPLGERFGQSRMVNTFREAAHKTLGVISERAGRASWTPAQFAAAQAYLEALGERRT